MVQTIRHEIGPDGDFPTLADWARALPPDLVAEDAKYVAQLGGIHSDPGGVVIDARCDLTRCAVICPKPGEGFRDLFDPLTDALAPTPGLGAMLLCLDGDAFQIRGRNTRVEIHGLQMICENGAALGPSEQANEVVLHDCIVDANSHGPVVALDGTRSALSRCVLIQRGSGDGVALENGVEIANSLIFKPTRPVATGTGVASCGERICSARSVAVFGFRQSFGPGLRNAERLVSDQINLIEAASDFSDPYWRRAGASVDPLDTMPSPFAVPLQRIGNNQNGFARLEGPVLARCDPGTRFAASITIALPSSLTSSLVLESPRARAELIIDWRTTPPTTHLSGPCGVLQAKAGGLTALGTDIWRVWFEVENTGTQPEDIRLALNVSRGTENVGLMLGMYAGAVMAGPGHLSNGFVTPNATPGRESLGGVDPAEALRSVSEAAPDLSPLPGGPLEQLFAPFFGDAGTLFDMTEGAHR